MSKQYTDSSQADPPGYSRQPIPLVCTEKYNIWKRKV